MKKYFISLLLIVVFYNGYAQTKIKPYKGNPDSLVRIMSNEIYNGTPLFTPQIQFQWYNDTVPVGKPQDEIENPEIWEVQSTFDSSKYYWKKQIYWEGKMNAELDRLNRTGHVNDISKNLVRFQDSAIVYKMKLEKYKSK